MLILILKIWLFLFHDLFFSSFDDGVSDFATLFKRNISRSEGGKAGNGFGGEVVFGSSGVEDAGVEVDKCGGLVVFERVGLARSFEEDLFDAGELD